MASCRLRRLQGSCLFCAVCAFLFVLGNLLLLHNGFSSLYSGNEETLSLPGPQHGPPSLQRALLSPSDPMLFELPIAAFSSETKFQRLIKSSKYRSASTVSSDNSTFRLTPEDMRDLLASTSDCDVINQADFNRKTFIASGWTKAVFRARFYGNNVAIKTVDASGHDVNKIMCQQHYGLSEAQCYDRAAYKLLKEVLLLQVLRHPHIVQVLAYCVPITSFSPHENSRVSMVTELGETLGLIKLLQMTWEDRLRVSFGLTKLLTYLAHSPLGPVVLNDFRHQQFIIIDGEVKLTDVDDVDFKQPSCETNKHCQQFFSSSNFTLSVHCLEGHCKGFNERKNVFNTGRHFTSVLLAPGAPEHLQHRVGVVVAAFSNATLAADELLQHLASIVDDYTNGAYLLRQSADHATAYKLIQHRDMPGIHDYPCPHSLVPNGCTMSVFDQREAEDICDQNPSCKAFVMTDQKTWTGRTIVHFKKGIVNPTVNSKVDLFVKPRFDS